MHPFCIGRHARIAMHDELLGDIKSFPNVWFRTHFDIAPEWRRDRVEQGIWDEPALTAAS